MEAPPWPHTPAVVILEHRLYADEGLDDDLMDRGPDGGPVVPLPRQVVSQLLQTELAGRLGLVVVLVAITLGLARST